MSKYRIGDKVKARSDLKVGGTYKGEGDQKDSFMSEMAVFMGKTVEIISNTARCTHNKYLIKGCEYNWTDEMFEPIYKVGDMVRMISQNPVYDKAGVNVGEVGTVLRILSDGDLSINFPNMYGWRGKPDEVELADSITTAEMFSQIAEGESYQRVSDGHVVTMKNGAYTWEPGKAKLSKNDRWTKVEDKEVSFLEAVKAYDRGTKIYCLNGADKLSYNHTYFNDFRDQNGRAVCSNEILNGKWYIKA